VKLFRKNSNLCDHNSPTLQTDRQTDRQTTCDGNTALCTKVHRAVKTSRSGLKRSRSHLEAKIEGLGFVSVSGKSGKVGLSSRFRLEQTFKHVGLVSVSKEKVSFTSYVVCSRLYYLVRSDYTVLRLSSVPVCNVCIVAKRCVLKQKLLLTA